MCRMIRRKESLFKEILVIQKFLSEHATEVERHRI